MPVCDLESKNHRLVWVGSPNETKQIQVYEV